MRIKLSPQRRDDTLEVVKAGNVLTVNGEVCDLTPMQEGSTLPHGAIDSEWFPGDVDMLDGELTLTLLLPLPINYSQEQAFPVDLVDVPDGPVIFPPPLTPEEAAAKFEQVTNLDVLNQMAPGEAMLAAIQMAQDAKGDVQ